MMLVLPPHHQPFSIPFLKRGIVFAGENFGPHLRFPARRRHEFGYKGSRLLPSPYPTCRLRTFASKVDPPVDREWMLHDFEIDARRYARYRVSRSILDTTGVLEGGFRLREQGGVQSQEPVSKERTQQLNALKASFYKILEDGQPDQVMNALLDPRFAHLVGSMPQSTFVEAFHLLSPTYFIDAYREIYRPLHPLVLANRKYKSLESIFDEFANNLGTIVRIRQEFGHVLDLAEYTHLLDCARSMGDANMADTVWHDMKRDEVIPDVQCYNYYMEAKVWDHAYTGREKYNLRVTPYYYRARRFFNPRVDWRGFGTGIRSVRKEVLQIFEEMTAAGNLGDEATYVNIILASARVGHDRGIRYVLKTVWNVDVDGLLHDDESNLPPVTPYDRSSPLHPTSCLLFAVAHALGTNNDLSGAMRTIDFISRSYDVAVPEKVWLELFERAFVLSRPRFGPGAERNSVGIVPFAFLTSMFETMISEPYNVRPTIKVYQILAKTAFTKAKLYEFERYMRLAYNLLSETRKKRRTARQVVEAYLSGRTSHSLRESSAFADAVNTYAILRLRTIQQTLLIENLARLLLIRRGWNGGPGRQRTTKERIILPRGLEEWQDFLPGTFYYGTTGGRVRFIGKTRWRAERLPSHDRIPMRRSTAVESAPEDEPWEIDDDIFWKHYSEKFPELDFNVPPLSRMNWKIPADGEESGLAHDELTQDTLADGERLDIGIPVSQIRETPVSNISSTGEHQEVEDENNSTAPNNWALPLN